MPQIAIVCYTHPGGGDTSQQHADVSRAGDVCAAAPVHGNLTMFTQWSGGVSHWALDENFLHTIPAETLLAERQQAVNFIAAGEAVVRKRVASLQAALGCRALDVQVGALPSNACLCRDGQSYCVFAKNIVNA